MKRFPAVATLVALFGCDNGVERQVYADPISGDEAIFLKRQLEDWQIYQPEVAPDRAIVIAKDDEPVVFLTDFADARWIATGEDTDVVLKDTDYDGKIDLIEFHESDPIAIHQATLNDGKCSYQVLREGAQDDGT